MENRKTFIARLTLLLVAICCTSASAWAEAAPVTTPPDRIFVLRWTFRADDLLACHTAAADLRRAKREFGDGVRIEAIAIDVEPELMQSFLRLERLTGVAVRHMSEREYRTAYHAEVHPQVALERGDHVVEVFAVGPPLPGRRTTAAIVPALRSLVSLAAR